MKHNQLGERIRLRRLELNLTQTQLAERTGYSDKTAISKIENGENDLTQSKIITFANALLTTPSYLMGWVEDPKPKLAKDQRQAELRAELEQAFKHPDIAQAYSEADEKTQKMVRMLLGLEE